MTDTGVQGPPKKGKARKPLVSTPELTRLFDKPGSELNKVLKDAGFQPKFSRKYGVHVKNYWTLEVVAYLMKKFAPVQK